MQLCFLDTSFAHLETSPSCSRNPQLLEPWVSLSPQGFSEGLTTQQWEFALYDLDSTWKSYTVISKSTAYSLLQDGMTQRQEWQSTGTFGLYCVCVHTHMGGGQSQTHMRIENCLKPQLFKLLLAVLHEMGRNWILWLYLLSLCYVFCLFWGLIFKIFNNWCDMGTDLADGTRLPEVANITLGFSICICVSQHYIT